MEFKPGSMWYIHREPVPCPECGHENFKVAAWLIENHELTFPCLKCGVLIDLGSAENRARIERMKDKIARIDGPHVRK